MGMSQVVNADSGQSCFFSAFCKHPFTTRPTNAVEQAVLPTEHSKANPVLYDVNEEFGQSNLTNAAGGFWQVGDILSVDTIVVFDDG